MGSANELVVGTIEFNESPSVIRFFMQANDREGPLASSISKVAARKERSARRAREV